MPQIKHCELETTNFYYMIQCISNHLVLIIKWMRMAQNQLLFICSKLSRVVRWTALLVARWPSSLHYIVCNDTPFLEKKIYFFSLYKPIAAQNTNKTTDWKMVQQNDATVLAPHRSANTVSITNKNISHHLNVGRIRVAIVCKLSCPLLSVPSLW